MFDTLILLDARCLLFFFRFRYCRASMLMLFFDSCHFLLLAKFRHYAITQMALLSYLSLIPFIRH